MTDWNDDDDDVKDEGPSSVDLDELGGDDDESQTLPCPSCGAEIYEDADRCSVCGQYVTPGRSGRSVKSWWWVLLGLIVLVMLILSLAF